MEKKMKNVLLMISLVSTMAFADISSVSYLPSQQKVALKTSLGFGDFTPRSNTQAYQVSSSSYALGFDLAYGVMKNHTLGGTIEYRSTDTTTSLGEIGSNIPGVATDTALGGFNSDGFSRMDLSWNYRFLSSFSRNLDFKGNFSLVSEVPAVSSVVEGMKNIGLNSTYTSRFSENFEGFVTAGLGYYFGGDRLITIQNNTDINGNLVETENSSSNAFISERIRTGARFHATSQFFVGGNLNLDSYQGFFSDPVFTLGINSGYKINPTSRIMAMASRSSFSDSDTVGWNLDLNYNMEI